MEIIKIPAERLGVLVGPEGKTKEMLEHELKVKIEIFREECAVELDGDTVDEYFGKDVIKAIGRGFEPKMALKLLREDYCLKIIDLDEYAHSKNGIMRLKGRVIGEGGRSKLIIEETGEANLSIYGNTVGVIAKLETVDIVMAALFKLLEGAMHSTVYAYLEKSRRKLKEDRATNLYSGGEKLGK